MTTDRRSVCSSIARIFAARQSSCGRSTVVFTFPDIDAARVTMAPSLHRLPYQHITVYPYTCQYGYTDPHKDGLNKTAGARDSNRRKVSRRAGTDSSGKSGSVWG